MSETDDRPEPDRVEGAPHPRETHALVGQEAAERAFLDSFNHGRLHHAWLITGPRGVGKATLAWRIARFLLSRSATGGASLLDTAPATAATLEVPADDPVARRVAALSEPRLHLLRRAWDDSRKPARLKTVISVEDVRALRGFFGLSAAEGGGRVVIVDAADEMNTQAANALLKVLEEPPEGATLLLISHQPSALLPTIRSRCRELRLDTLGPAQMAEAMAAAGHEASEDAAALAELAAGSVGEAIRLANMEGLERYRAIIELFATLPGMDRGAAIALADGVAGRGAETRLELTLWLLDLFLTRLARAGVMGPPATEAAPREAELLARLSPGENAARTWAALQQELGAQARRGRAVNLDPAALVLDMVLRIDTAAAPLARPA